MNSLMIEREEQGSIKTHDSHYRAVEEKTGVQPIDLIEQAARVLIENGADPERAYDFCAGMKYLLRSGKKVGESAEKEFAKFLNYGVRALTGHWIGQ